LAKGARILGEDRYAQAARAAIDFLRRHLWDDGRQILQRRYREGQAAIDGFLDDYAYVGLALLDLYEATFEASDFEWAVRLAERALELFEDTVGGGFFSAMNDGTLDDGALLRLKDDYDGAEPSGNSGITLLLLRLARMTDRSDFRAAAERTLRAFAPRMQEAGTGVPQMLVAHSFALAKPREIVMAGPADDPMMKAMLASINRRFLPDAVVMRAEQCTRPMPAVGGAPTAYVCENFACHLPVTDTSALADLLK
jgi:uncharacterized protein YyaL (SSP411 family)